MRTLLIHALKSEATHLIAKHALHDSKEINRGVFLTALSESYQLLRTGIGLEKTRFALDSIPPDLSVDRILHFGVSGSLTSTYPVGTLLRATVFHADDSPALSPLQWTFKKSSTKIDTTEFYSSTVPIVSDEQRYHLACFHSCGAVDMESYAVAAYCVSHQIPLFALRIVSDQAGNSSEADFRKNYGTVSEKLQTILVKELLLS